MNIDDKIKQALEDEAHKLDQVIAHEPGIFNMLTNAYKGALGGWMILVTFVTLVVTAVMFWAGYKFFFVEHLNGSEAIYWGVILILSALMQVTLKMWTFMEMNRQSTNREVKRLELTIERLIHHLSANNNS